MPSDYSDVTSVQPCDTYSAYLVLENTSANLKIGAHVQTRARGARSTLETSTYKLLGTVTSHVVAFLFS